MFSLQVDDDDVVAILLQMEIIPLCMHNMDFASPLAKEVRITINHFDFFLHFVKALHV